MEKKPAGGAIFNIYGGNVQILPNATKAEQHFYDSVPMRENVDDDSLGEPLTDAARKLELYINKVEDLSGYLAKFAACTTARDIGEVVAFMAEREPKLTSEEIDKTRFISLLPSLAPKVTKGITVDNLRIHIDNAVTARKRASRKSPSGAE